MTTDSEAKKMANDARRTAKSIRSAVRSEAWKRNSETKRAAVDAANEGTETRKKK